MNELATIDNQELAPMDMLDGGQQAAAALLQVVDRSKSNLIVTIGKNEYLKVEGWIFLGRANNTFAATDSVHAIVDENGDVQAYEAKVNLMKNGMIVGSAIAECGIDSSVTKGAEGRDKHNAAKSMAQTRATSKAFRMVFSWVAVLAGYSPTPAEEMQRGESTQAESGEHWCEEHQVEWFKTAKMRSYGHPPKEDGGEWCHMPSEKPQEGKRTTGLPRQMTAQGFATECAKLGLDGKGIDEMFDGKDGVKMRIDAGETWEDLLAVAENALQPEPPEDA